MTNQAIPTLEFAILNNLKKTQYSPSTSVLQESFYEKFIKIYKKMPDVESLTPPKDP